MPRQARQLAESGIYHAMARGVNRDAIFLDNEDFEHFLASLARVRDASGCSVLAYCLMTNHVHLVVRTADEPIGTVMKRLGVRYAGWFNRKYGRVGHVFQDRFKSFPVESDGYFVSLLRYGWNTPVEAGLASFADEYRWGSRRLLGKHSSLIDAEELGRLAPADVLSEPIDPEPIDGVAPYESGTEPSKGRRPTRTQPEVDRLLRRACGAGSPTQFHDLPMHTRRRAIAELRTRGVSYSQIAGATGMSPSAVRRLHVAGEPAPGHDPADR